jgi:thiol-disulfide isomerase/thioredoxin
MIFCIIIAMAPRFACSEQGSLVREKFPALSSGMFADAVIETLDKGNILLAEGLTITEADLKKALAAEQPELQKQLEKNLIFVLEQETVRLALVREAKKGAIGQDSQDDDSRIEQFLAGKIAGVSVSEQEIAAFYQENKNMMGTTPFDTLKEDIREYLLQEKKEEAITASIEKLTDSLRFRIDGAWLEEQNRLALDNPVDKARSSGKPTLAEFGATGCTPCDMMQPILADLRKKHLDTLNVVFIHVGEEQVLGARYGISSIPVQVFFDASGKEVFRHTGYFAAEDINKQLAAMGVTK